MKHLALPCAAPTVPLPRARAYTGKRALDLVGTTLLLVPALPLIALLWMLVRRDGGPGFFGHWRVGRGGRPFRCWKLRSMVPGAEAVLARHLAANPKAAAQWAAEVKLRDDPRITALGRVLRRTSLDELPQLFNVLRGEMSLVGLRPVTAGELARYGPYQSLYLALRPGITGLWQVSGRGCGSDYDTRVAMDIAYGTRASLGLDLAILARTVGAVLRRTGS